MKTKPVEIEDFNIDKQDNLHIIRNQIINVVYFCSVIVGTFATYGSVMRYRLGGWQPIFFFHIILFFGVWFMFLFRNKIPMKIKAYTYFVLFFANGFVSNFFFGIISGSVNFVVVCGLITLFFGWKPGTIAIFLTIIAQSTIAFCYSKGILHYNYNIEQYSTSIPITVSIIVGGVYVSSIFVFSINKFYKWLIISLKTITEKAYEITKKNQELVIAKQKAEEHDHLKSMFLANMSHEVRTPMNAIIGFSELLNKPNLKEDKRKRYTSIIQEKANDLLRIIEDILDISKIEAGQLNLIETQVNIYDLMVDLYEFYKIKSTKFLSEKKIDINCNVPDYFRNNIFLIDKQRLKQVLQNLIDNAFKYTNEGYIDVNVEICNGNELKFSVRDTGPGIPNDMKEAIFDRFRQIKTNDNQHINSGTGLGLSIVQGILALMNGKIWVESEINKGSVFYFTLPAKIADN